MQQFLKDTIQSRFIKSLLQDTYIPRYQSVVEGDYIVEDTNYIYGYMIIICTKSGVLGQDAKYKKIANYDRNTTDFTIQGNFVSKESFYDSAMHQALGEYLRYYRGQTNIDLMPLYNCYNNVYNSSFTLTLDGISPVSNKLVKVLQVPIKFNKTYTIAIDCSSTVIMCPAFIVDSDYVFSGDTNITGLLYSDSNPTKYFSFITFTDPVTFRIDNEDPFLQRYEYCLTLLIQIPYNCDSSVVVLEGDYTGVGYKNVITMENCHEDDYDYNGLDSIIPYEQNKLFISNPSLLKVNDKVTYAFADKLILYLLENAITSNDEIYHDIERVQKELDPIIYNNYITDVWDDKIRKILYDKYFDKTTDVLGYVDTDIEDFLLKDL